MDEDLEKLDELSMLILIILGIADECNYQGGALSESDVFIIANYVVNNQIDITEILKGCKDDITAGINFLSVALNRN